MTIIKEPRWARGTRGAVEEKMDHHRRSATEASASPTLTAERSWMPRYHRPCSDLRRFVLARVHRDSRNGASNNTPYARMARTQPRCIVQTDIDVGVEFTTHPLDLANTHTS